MDTNSIVLDVAEKVFRNFSTHAVREASATGQWPAALWQQMSEVGLMSAAASADHGGGGLPIRECCEIAKLVGRYAVPAPLMDAILAQYALSQAHLPPVSDLIGIAPQAPVVTKEAADGAAISGRIGKVPWGRQLAGLVVVVQRKDGFVTAIAKAPFKLEASESLAGEPLDTIVLDEHRISSSEMGALGAGLSFKRLHALGALFRAAQTVGALKTVLEMTIKYAQERSQFGRPITKFQAIQQQIAVMGSEVVAAEYAVDAAAEAADELKDATFEIAAAKTRLGKSASISFDVSHQVHGAIGTVREFPLHHFTMRILAWREEFGSPDEWSSWIGTEICRNGGAALWPFLVDRRSL